MSIIASTSNELKFHQWPDGQIHQTYVPPKYTDGHIRSISWSKDGSWVVLVPHGGPPEIISIRDRIKILQTISEISCPTHAVFQNSTKKNIAVGTVSGHIFIYDVKSRDIKKRFPKAHAMVNQLQYNARDTHLAASCSNGEIIVYNGVTENLFSSFAIPKCESVETISFHRTRRNLLGAGNDKGIVASWDINTNATLLETQIHHAPVTALTYSPIRSDMLVTAGLDRRFTFFDILAKKCILEVDVKSPITSLDFSYCGTYLGLGSQIGTVILYDTRNLSRPISMFEAHEEKTIRHLLFQKILTARIDEDRSNHNVAYKRASLQEESCSDPSVNPTVVMAYGNSTCSSADVEPERKLSQESVDPFSVIVSWERHSQGDNDIKADKIDACVAGETKQWMDMSQRPLTPHNSFHNMKRNIEAPVPLSPAQNFNGNLDNITTSPAVVEVVPHNGILVDQTIRNLEVVESHLQSANHLSLSYDELKNMMKEVVRKEFESQLEIYKNEVRTEFAETLGHMRRHFLDLQMSIVKEFVAIEASLEKMKSMTVREFMCNDFLLNQNTKLLKEIDGMKERIVEKDQFRGKF